MPTYITLANFTDQGIRNYKDTMKRAQAFRDMVGQMGGEVKRHLLDNGGLRHRGDHASHRRRDGKGNLCEVVVARERAHHHPAGFGMDEIERIIEKAE